MIKQVLKRLKVERLAAKLTGVPQATVMTIVHLEWFKFQMRRRATSAALTRFRLSP